METLALLALAAGVRHCMPNLLMVSGAVLTYIIGMVLRFVWYVEAVVWEICRQWEKMKGHTLHSELPQEDECCNSHHEQAVR